MKPTFFILALLSATFFSTAVFARLNFTWTQKSAIDGHGQQVIVFVCEGLQKDIEAIVFSMNRYGDHTISGYSSLQEFGYGRISGSQIAIKALPDWARSRFSSNPQEVQQNKEFRQFLIDLGILSKGNHLSSVYQHGYGALLFYFSDMKFEPEATQIHENSHVFFNNLKDYRAAAYSVFDTLSVTQRSCVYDFFKKKPIYSITDKDLIVDEFVAYYVEEYKQLQPCVGDFGPDINKDGRVSRKERYVWQSSHR